MKQRIFIAMHYLELGGAENALIGLLHAMNYSKVSVDLFLYAHRGELMDQIPPQVKLLPEIPAYAHIEAPLIRAISHGHYGVACGRLKARMLKRIHSSRVSGQGDDASIFSYIGRCVTPHLPMINTETYDAAISFLTPHDIVLSKVKAHKKICWIHTDYSRIAIDRQYELPIWQAYDHIISISPDVTRSFTSVFPELSGKITEIANILPETIIRNKAAVASATEFDNSCFKLLSIGRFSTPKNFDNIPDMARRLRDKHGLHNFRWYIIGYGPDEQLIRNKIAEANVDDCVVLLGKRNNPYPYIAACDLYVQPSRYEGRCVTVREAQLLGKPVVTSNYPTASSQVSNGVDGFILPLDNADFAAGLHGLITNPQSIAAVTANIAAADYSDRSEATKLLSLIHQSNA